MPVSCSIPPRASGRSTWARSSTPQGGKERPLIGAFRSQALAMAAISMADLVPSMNEVNIRLFMPAALASAAVMP